MKIIRRQNLIAAALVGAMALTASFIAPAQSAELADQQTVTDAYVYLLGRTRHTCGCGPNKNEIPIPTGANRENGQIECSPLPPFGPVLIRDSVNINQQGAKTP